MTMAAAATSYQRDWIKGLRAEITQGAPFAFVNADTPHEIFHFMDVPMVTNQWWSAVIAAKQQAPFYFDWMEDAGFHRHLPKYSSLPLMALLEGDAARQPWGACPRPLCSAPGPVPTNMPASFSCGPTRPAHRCTCFPPPPCPTPPPTGGYRREATGRISTAPPGWI